jgi:hypothetical protein
MITGLDHVQVSIAAGSEATARAAALTVRGDEVTRSEGELPGIRRFHTFDPFGNRLESQQA